VAAMSCNLIPSDLRQRRYDEQVLTINLNLGTGPFSEQHAVACFELESHEVALLVAGTGADGDDLAFLGFFLRGVGNDDAASGLLVTFDAAHDHAVAKDGNA
jgi:hypothetical protein